MRDGFTVLDTYFHTLKSGIVIATTDVPTVREWHRLAEHRHEIKRAAGIPNELLDRSRDPILGELAGIACECIVGRYLGLPWAADARRSGRAGKARVTHTHPSGVTIRANSSRYELFIASSVADFGADIGVLVGEGPTLGIKMPYEAKIFGAISRAEFTRLCRPAFHAGAPCVEVHRRDLPHTPAALKRRLDGPAENGTAPEAGEQGKLF